jgi:hypothetical protein
LKERDSTKLEKVLFATFVPKDPDYCSIRPLKCQKNSDEKELRIFSSSSQVILQLTDNLWFRVRKKIRGPYLEWVLLCHKRPLEFLASTNFSTQRKFKGVCIKLFWSFKCGRQIFNKTLSNNSSFYFPLMSLHKKFY